MGRWDGEYDDGTSPSEWSGSIKILEEYVKTNKAVRYGQCWVFAGVVNTGEGFGMVGTVEDP